MIRRAAIFLVLLVGGFLALYTLIGDTQGRARAGGGAPAVERGQGKDPPTDTGTRPPRGPGIHLDTGKPDSAVTLRTGGKQTLTGTEEVHLPSGAIRLVPVYELHSKDSRTEPDNKYTLLDVTVDLFTVDTSDPDKPRAVPNGRLEASRARLELSQSGQIVRLEEDKLIELWDVVYTTAPRSSLRQMVIKVGQARILNTDDKLRLWTPDPRERVEIVAQGRRGFEIEGRGLEAWAPISRDDKGKVKIIAGGLRNLRVLSDSVLTERDTVLRARGPLTIEEDGRTGAALVTMRDDVFMETRFDRAERRGGQKTRRRAKVVARGDTLRGTLVRTKLRGKDTTIWTSIDLRGTPARLEDEGQVDLTCAHLSVLPDAESEPYWFTAFGDERFPTRMEYRHEGEVHRFDSGGRVHVVRLHRQHGLLLSDFGIPLGNFPSQFEQVIVFEGQSTVTSPTDDLKIVADRGMTVVRSEQPALRDSFVLSGQGPIRVTGDGLRIDGNRGFTLVQTVVPGGPKGRLVVRDIQIGPRHQDAGHRYEVEHRPVARRPGTRARPALHLHLTGTGACALHMVGGAIDRLELSSLAEDIGFASKPAAGKAGRISIGRAWQLGSALALFRPDGSLERFVGKGEACRVSMTGKDGTIEGSAREIHQEEPGAWRLAGNPAELRHSARGFLRGRTVLVRRLAEDDVQLHAILDAHLHSEERVPQKGSRPAVRAIADLRADEVRVEPFLEAPEVTLLLEQRLPVMPGFGLDTRHLFAEGAVVLDYLIDQGGDVQRGTCRGDALTLRSDREGRAFADGLLRGAPAEIDNLDGRGRRSVARADLLRFFGNAGAQELTLYPVGARRPQITAYGDLRQTPPPPDVSNAAPGAPPRPAEPYQVLVCDGEIAVRPGRIACGGPVQVRSFDARGTADPAGLRLDARSLELDRTEAGTLAAIRAAGDIDFGWSGVTGDGDALTIDLLKTTLQVRGIERPAEVRLPNDVVTVRHLIYNYRTRMTRFWKANFKQATTAR